jgi:hypothetical protein
MRGSDSGIAEDLSPLGCIASLLHVLLTASQRIIVPSSAGAGAAHRITSWKYGVFMLEAFS